MWLCAWPQSSSVSQLDRRVKGGSSVRLRLLCFAPAGRCALPGQASVELVAIDGQILIHISLHELHSLLFKSQESSLCSSADNVFAVSCRRCRLQFFPKLSFTLGGSSRPFEYILRYACRAITGVKH